MYFTELRRSAELRAMCEDVVASDMAAAGSSGDASTSVSGSDEYRAEAVTVSEAALAEGLLTRLWEYSHASSRRRAAELVYAASVEYIRAVCVSGSLYSL